MADDDLMLDGDDTTLAVPVEDDAVDKSAVQGKGNKRASLTSQSSTTAGSSGASAQPEEKKDCTDCLREKYVSEFSKNQIKCKACRSGMPLFLSVLIAQNQKEWYDEKKRTEPKKAAKLFCNFQDEIGIGSKANSQSKKKQAASLYNLHEAKETAFAETNTEKREIGKFMWEGEYYEWSHTTAAGNLTKEERELTMDVLSACQSVTFNEKPVV